MFSLCSTFTRLHVRAPTPLRPKGVRHKVQLAPRKANFVRRHQGRVGIPIGGSIKGTTLKFGDWGLRVKGDGALISARTLMSAHDVLDRRLKPMKGSKVYLRTFPDLPVSVKGNETRMGKGKGAFEFWARRVMTGRVVFEIGGKVKLREELARKIFREVESRFPTKMEFINKDTPPRLGRLLLYPPTEEVEGAALVESKVEVAAVPTQMEVSSTASATQP